jgi:hypothetical protein
MLDMPSTAVRIEFYSKHPAYHPFLQVLLDTGYTYEAPSSEKRGEPTQMFILQGF